MAGKKKGYLRIVPHLSRAGEVRQGIRFAGLFLIVLCFLTGGAAAGIQTALGTTVHLAGISYGSTSVYLFLTGPNLPADGVALDNTGSSGGFTRVDVDVDGRWDYDWNTHAIPLDAGIYTVWVVNDPVGRTELAGHDYATIAVAFSRPTLSISTPVVPGSLEVSASPGNSSIVFNGQYQGMTPLTIGNLAPGSYTATVSHFGYRPVSRSVLIEAGSITVMNVSLAPFTGAIRIASEPDSARILLDGRDAGTTPLIVQDIPVGNHTITAQKDGYDSAEKTVLLSSDRQVVNVSFTLGPSRGPAGTSATQAGNTVPAIILVATGVLLYGIFRQKKR